MAAEMSTIRPAHRSVLRQGRHRRRREELEAAREPRSSPSGHRHVAGGAVVLGLHIGRAEDDRQPRHPDHGPRGHSAHGPGDFFGEMALLTKGPRSATITAMSDMELLVLSPAEFVSLLDDSPRVAVKMLGRLADRIRALESAPTH